VTTDSPGANLAFLTGGGTMGELIAGYDWGATSLGPIASWSATVTTTIGLALRSAVPMVMLWGEDGIMIYNDAYSVFAGGRHPGLLGSRVREGWPEVADFNDNVMKTVLGRGETLAYVDQELLLYRHGHAEQLWTNLDYSPIVDASGARVGVIAIVVETTEKVRAERWLADERERLRAMFEQAPSFMAMLRGPEHVFELTNAAYLQLIGHRHVIGKRLSEALPEVAGQGFAELLDRVYASGEPYIGQASPVRLQRNPDGPQEERILDFIYQPVRDPAGRVVGIFVDGADVTDRVAAETAARDSAGLFRSFAEAMPNHVWTARPDGYLDWFNSQVYAYGAALPGTLDGSGWAAMVHPDDLPEAAARWADSLASGTSYEVEFRLRRADGAFRWYIARATPIRDDDGRIVRWIGTNTDIDDQKAVIAELAMSEARLNLAIEAGQMAVWEIDLPTLRITPSAALNRLYGFPEDATPTLDDFRSRYAPGEAERLSALAAQSTQGTRRDLDAEVRHVWPDGSEKWMLIRAHTVDDGRRAIGVVVDITGRKRVEQRLAESEQRFRLSQDAARIASLELDIASGVVIGSSTFWELWGLTPRDSVHISTLEAIVLPEDANIRSNPDTRVAGTAAPSVEYRVRRPDTGQIRWLARHIEFVRDADGKPIKMFGIMRDVTEEKEAQARQELLTHELEHRIKNILAMVSAIASQTLRSGDLDTARAAFTERLQALAKAHDILNRSRWTTAALGEVVSAATAQLPGQRVVSSGPEVKLPPRMALSLALAINELGTNALKYGALSVEAGAIAITWQVEDRPTGPALVWAWREGGGPPVTAPSRRGFGRFLIERVLATDFGGTVSLQYLPEGVTCTLTAPLPPQQGAAP